MKWTIQYVLVLEHVNCEAYPLNTFFLTFLYTILNKSNSVIDSIFSELGVFRFKINFIVVFNYHSIVVIFASPLLRQMIEQDGGNVHKFVLRYTTP